MLDEAQAGFKIAGRNINNLRWADDATLMAESEEELKSLLMKVKRRVKNLALSSTVKKLRSWYPVLSLHGKQLRTMWKQCQISFSWAPKSLWMMTAAMKLKQTKHQKHLILGRKAMTDVASVLKSRAKSV